MGEKNTITFNGKVVRLKKDGSVNLTDLPKDLRIKYKEAYDKKKAKENEDLISQLLQMLD
jgi:hypothetical protein